MSRKAVFLDRDGTINEDSGYPTDFSQIKIYPFSFEAVRRLNQVGLPVIILTNQSAVGRGLLSEENLRLLHQKMQQVFQENGARLDAFYYCPHYEHSSFPPYHGNCFCRKPKPGLALRAASDFGLDLEDSYIVGDKVEDMLLGLEIRATPVLVLTGYGMKAQAELKARGVKPAYIASDLLQAVNWILEKEKELTSSSSSALQREPGDDSI